MRKAKQQVGPVSGNAKKFDSYREAWTRIEYAQNDQYYLEAIAIEESIIADRLISYLSSSHVEKPIKKDKRGRYPSFALLIKKLNTQLGAPLATGGMTDLCGELDRWRNNRNRAIHAFVTSDPGTPTISVDDFLRDVRDAADMGAKLARAVCAWHKSSKTKAKYHL